MMRDHLSWDTSWRRACRIVLAAGVLALVPLSFAASPPRGSDAPRITLTNTDGGKFDTADFKGKTLVLVFGELSHEKLAQACADIDAALSDPRLPKDAAAPVLLVAHEPAPEALAKAREAGHLPKLVVKDLKREAFGAYQIVVVPTVVVVGPDGKVVYSLPSFTPNFKEVLTEAALLAAGQIEPAQFEQTLAHPTSAPVSGPEAKASRLTHLARELARRDLPEMAEQRYKEALEAWPKSIEARLGLGELLLSQDRLDDAETNFKAALELTPTSLDAMLGLDATAIKRGGEGLAKADMDVRRIISNNPKLARAHYLLGLIHQQQSEHADAAACFRRAFELLMEQGESR
jgi:tetratricopeptide (TPR) repeat protein